jgi:hypothetical protein
MEYSLDQKVEQDLWNFGHKNFITALQSIVKDKEVKSKFFIKKIKKLLTLKLF